MKKRKKGKKIMGKLTVNVGGMFSGKSTELLRQGKRHILAGQKTVFLKPIIDDRYNNYYIVTHKGEKIPAINITDSILVEDVKKADVILLDEIQFFKESVIEEVLYLISEGKKVYASGLDMDFLGVPFRNTMLLMGVADTVNKLHAVCSKCGDDAVMSARISYSVDQIELGSGDKYLPLCRSCYMKFRSERGI